MQRSQEPRIIAFCCHWCSYGAADLAGVFRLSYPKGVRIIRVMCMGMVSPSLVMEAFTRGADGVVLVGCHPGECYYLEGNTKAAARVKIIKQTMAMMGLEPERLALASCSAAEPEGLVRALWEMNTRLVKLSTMAQAVEAGGEAKA